MELFNFDIETEWRLDVQREHKQVHIFYISLKVRLSILYMYVKVYNWILLINNIYECSIHESCNLIKYVQVHQAFISVYFFLSSQEKSYF